MFSYVISDCLLLATEMIKSVCVIPMYSVLKVIIQLCYGITLGRVLYVRRCEKKFDYLHLTYKLTSEIFV